MTRLGMVLAAALLVATLAGARAAATDTAPTHPRVEVIESGSIIRSDLHQPEVGADDTITCQHVTVTRRTA